MTFEVLRVLREQNMPVHCIVNSWENHRIVPLAERIGASWSIGRYSTSLRWRTRNPLEVALMLGDVLATSFGLLRDAWRFRPTHILLPEFQAVLRNAPALLLLRAVGVQVILRVGNAPDRGKFYERLWRRVLPCFVETFVPNSRFTMQRMLDYGIAPRKVQLIGNAVSVRTNLQPGTDGDLIASAARRTTLLCVGQIAEFKGTHLFAEACTQLIRMGYDIDALIIGRLPSWPADFVRYVDRIRENLHRYGLTERVRMVGERENIPGIMSAAYVLAAPIPAEESFGNVVLESQAAGLPPVIFPNGGLTELVEHEVTGYVCQECSVEALVCGLRYFLDDPAARDKMSRSCRAAFGTADHSYSPARFKNQWTGIFQADRVPALQIEMERSPGSALTSEGKS
jgi:glycosyltransferase involved in cell wall biosynthesis